MCLVAYEILLTFNFNYFHSFMANFHKAFTFINFSVATLVLLSIILSHHSCQVY